MDFTRGWLDEIRMDLKGAVRGFLRVPGFTVAAVLTLALSIGANTAIFSVMRSVLLRPLPYPDSEQLVQIWADHRALGRAEPEWLAPPDFLDLREQNRTFSGMSAYVAFQATLTGVGDPEAVPTLVTHGNFFEILRARPALGRLLTMADDDPGAPTAVVISHALWQQRFGGDSSIVNTSISINGNPNIVVGVLSPDFTPPIPGEAHIFATFQRPVNAPCGRGCVTWRAIGRMKPGVTIDAAQADYAAINRSIGEQFPRTNAKVGAWLVPLHTQITGESRTAVYTLASAVGLVLLIGCVNVAGLLLVRGAGRGRELSVRAALGAGRGRILRQLLTEHTLLAVVGGLLGLWLGVAGSNAAGALVSDNVRRVQDIHIDPTVALFALAATLLSVAIFGLAPAVYAVRGSAMHMLRSGARSTRRTDARLRNGLVVAQLTLAVVLLVGAGLLMRSFMLMQGADLGYRTTGVLLTNIALPASRYPVEQVVGAASTIVDRLRDNPAIRIAELVDMPPFSVVDRDANATPVGEPDRDDYPPSIWMRSVTPGYLDVMQFRLTSGRQFTREDGANAPLVCIINDEAARRYFRGVDPIGREMILGDPATGRRVTIVGVVASGRHDGARAPVKTEMFVPFDQTPRRGVTLVVEPTRDAASASTVIRSTMRELDPMMAIGVISPIEELARATTEQPRVYAMMVATFALAALLLAALGVYGVQAYTVKQREHEIGVRLALGAPPTRIRNLVLRDAAVLGAFGLVAGVVAAFAAGRFAESMLFGVSAFDGPTLVIVAVVLALATLVAAWIPARRALRLDPLKSMRQD